MAVKRSRSSSGIGGSLILIIFIVLTITIFSVLTLVSAENELGTVNRAAEISKNYYNAEKIAAQKCGEIKEAIAGIGDISEIAETAANMDTAASTDESGVNISFSVDIDENRALETVLRAEQGQLTVISKKIVSKSTSIIIDDTIEIWDGF